MVIQSIHRYIDETPRLHCPVPRDFGFDLVDIVGKKKKNGTMLNDPANVKFNSTIITRNFQHRNHRIWTLLLNEMVAYKKKSKKGK